MPERSLENAWRAALAVIALVALVAALYVQLLERRDSREEERLSAARLESELAQSRARLKAEIVKELATEKPAEPPGDQPLPNAVLRRSEPGQGSGLQEVRESQESQEVALARLRERLDALVEQSEQSDRALRRDYEELRAEIQREQRASGRTLSLILVALVPLVLHFLASLWRPGKRRRDRGEPTEL